MPTELASPPPAPTPAPAAEKPPTDYLQGIPDDLAALDVAEAEPPKPRGDDGKFKPTPKPAEKPPEKPVEAPPKPADKAPEKPVEAPATAAEVKPVKAAELRTAYEGLKKRVKEELEPENQRLKSKITELESRKPEDSAPIVAKLTALEKRNAELEKQIEYVDYSQSKDFTDKFAKPYQDAWTDAVAEFRELTVREPDGIDPATEEPKFKTRPADENDLLKLANMKLSDMDEAATTMFGHSAARAINHIQNLKKLSAAQHKALEDAKTKAGDWKASRTVEQQKKQQTLANAWTEVNKGLETKYPKAFKAEEGNADDAAAHSKGFALADLMFVGAAGLKPEQIEALPPAFRDAVKANQALTDVQQVQLHALARLKMANHDRLIAAQKKHLARIAELEKALAEYEDSEPPAGKAGAKTADAITDPNAIIEEELRALDK